MSSACRWSGWRKNWRPRDSRNGSLLRGEPLRDRDLRAQLRFVRGVDFQIERIKDGELPRCLKFAQEIHHRLPWSFEAHANAQRRVFLLPIRHAVVGRLK